MYLESALIGTCFSDEINIKFPDNLYKKYFIIETEYFFLLSMFVSYSFRVKIRNVN
jgi:hypothetical protein